MRQLLFSQTELWDAGSRLFSSPRQRDAIPRISLDSSLYQMMRPVHRRRPLRRTRRGYHLPYLRGRTTSTISSAPAAVAYGQALFIATADAASIARATWIGLTSTTHGFNMDQRINQLTFTPTPSSLNVVAPTESESVSARLLHVVRAQRYRRPVHRENNFYHRRAAISTTGGADELDRGRRIQRAINLTWADNATTENGFQIERALDGAALRRMATVAAECEDVCEHGVERCNDVSLSHAGYDRAGASAWSNVSNARTGNSMPFGAAPIGVSGTLQAEDSTMEGEGVAYHDSSAGNEGAQYRSTNVGASTRRRTRMAVTASAG